MANDDSNGDFDDDNDHCCWQSGLQSALEGAPVNDDAVHNDDDDDGYLPPFKDKDKINEQSKILLTIETLITFSEVNMPLIKDYGFY